MNGRPSRGRADLICKGWYFAAAGWITAVAATLGGAPLPEGVAPAWSPEAGRILLRNFSPGDYGGDGEVVGLVQAPGGAIYVAEAGGVARFDGARWTYQVSPSRPLLGLAADGSDAVRVNTAAGDWRFECDPVGGWRVAKLAAAAAADAPSGLRLRLRSGVVAEAAGEGGVRLVHPDGQTQVVDALRGLAGQRVTSLMEDGSGGLWVGHDAGVSRLDPGSGQSLFFRRDGLERSPVRAMARWGERLVMAQNRGLYRLEPAQRDGVGQPVRPAVFTPLPVADAMQPGSLMAGRDGALWVGSAMGRQPGLWRMEEGVEAEHWWDVPVWAVLAEGPDETGVLVLTATGVVWVQSPARRQELLRQEGVAAGEWVWQPGAGDESVLWWSENGAAGLVRYAWSGRDGQRMTAESVPWPAGLVAGEPGAAGPRLVAGPAGEPWLLSAQGLWGWTEPGGWQQDDRAEFWRRQKWEPVTAAPQPGLGWWVVLRDPTRPRWRSVVCLGPDGQLVGRVSPVVGEAVGLATHTIVRWDAAGEALWVGGAEGLARVAEDAPGRAEGWKPAPLVTWLESAAEPLRGAGEITGIMATNGVGRRYTAGLGSLRLALTWPVFDGEEPPVFEMRDPAGGAWRETPAETVLALAGLPAGKVWREFRARDPLRGSGAVTTVEFELVQPWILRWETWFGGATGLAVCWWLAMRLRLAVAERERLRLERLVAERTEAMAQAVEAAERAGQAKTVFLANASHELRNPLNSILGYVRVLESAETSGDGQRERRHERMQNLRRSAEHLERLLGHVLDLSKLEANAAGNVMEQLRLSAWVRDVLAAHRPEATRRGLELSCDIEPSVPRLACSDGLRLRQVLDNLLGNAIKFTPAGGRVGLRVRARDEGGAGTRRVGFEVWDTGPGIRPEDQARVFEPFQQVRSAGQDGRGLGAGLGLPLARRLVERLGGILELKSEPGEGCCFRFELSLTCEDGAALGEPLEAVLREQLNALLADARSGKILAVRARFKRLEATVAHPLIGTLREPVEMFQLEELVRRAQSALDDSPPVAPLTGHNPHDPA